MKVFTAIGTDRYELVHPVDQADWETLTVLLDGRSRKQAWRPVRVRIVKEEHDGTPFAASASPWLCMSHALVFKQDALIELGDYLSRIGEILPLECDDEPLFVWQPLTIIDALDRAASEVLRFKSGRIMHIRRHAFIAERVEGVEAFKISDLRVSPVFFSEHAVQIISSVVGPGLEFMAVWSTEVQEPNQALETNRR